MESRNYRAYHALINKALSGCLLTRTAVKELEELALPETALERDSLEQLKTNTKANQMHLLVIAVNVERSNSD